MAADIASPSSPKLHVVSQANIYNHRRAGLTMTDVRRIAPSREVPPTEAGRFLAKRGHIVMKQFHEIGKLKSDYGPKLTFSTLVFAIAQGTKGDRTFGLRIEHETDDGRRESCLIDFDELKELLFAIKHLFDLAPRTAEEPSDYSEFEYITRDDLKVGFYQESSGLQQAFFDVSPGGSMMFLSFDQLRGVFAYIKKGREYLIEKGAIRDAGVEQDGRHS